MSATLVGINGGTTTNARTPTTPFRILDVGGDIDVTNTTALPALGAEADILRNANQEPQSVLAEGRLIFTPAAGSLALLAFFGTDAEDETGTGRVWAWHQFHVNGSSVSQWSRYLVCEFEITLGAKVGVAGAPVSDSHLWADTIEITKNGGLGPNQCRVLGRDVAGTVTADGNQQYLAIDMLGAAFGEVELSMDGGTAASIGVAVGHLTGV